MLSTRLIILRMNKIRYTSTSLIVENENIDKKIDQDDNNYYKDDDATTTPLNEESSDEYKEIYEGYRKDD